MAALTVARKPRRQNKLDPATRKFCEELLHDPRLPPRVYHAIRRELGHTINFQKEKHQWAQIFWLLIQACKAHKRKNEERPRGGFHEAAVAEVAEGFGMSATNLKQFIRRHKGNVP